MSRDMPGDTEYVFVNPLDDKTRHLCVKMVSFGKMTKKEIEANFPVLSLIVVVLTVEVIGR